MTHIPDRVKLEINLGNGDKLITDIYGDDWAGIAISNGECAIGEIIDTGAKTVADLNPIVSIISTNPKSLDVIIQACERAKEHLSTAAQPASSSETQ